MSKSFPKPEITLDRIYSEFADEGYCKDYLLDVRFEKYFACPFCGGSECRKIKTRHLFRCKSWHRNISTFLRHTIRKAVS